MTKALRQPLGCLFLCLRTVKGTLMAYTPELSYENSCTLRRIAWASHMPMTTAINEVIQAVAEQLDHKDVCASCRDKSKCDACCFSANRGIS